MNHESHQHARRHHNELQQRQAVIRTEKAVKTTVVRTTARATVTRKPPVVRPTKAPEKPVVTPLLPSVDPVTPVPPVPPVPSRPVPSPPILTTIPAISVPTAVTTTTPLSLAPTTPIITTSRTLLSRTSSTNASASIAPAAPSAPSASSGISTGAVVGGIIGGFICLGIIGAAVFLFLRRINERKRRRDEAFDATKFRQSAVLLDDPAEKRGKPRPPTMIERHVRNTPPQSTQPTTSDVGQYGQEQAQYGGQGPYGAPYNLGPYGAQTSYGQYPALPMGAYTQQQYDPYGAHQGYPPQPHYPLQSHYTHQQYPYAQSEPTPLHHPQSSSSEQNHSILPNPFASLPSHLDGRAAHAPTAPSTSTNLSYASEAQGAGVPPAYEVSSNFSDYKPDVKGKPAPLSVTNNTGESNKGAISTSLSQASATATVSSSTSSPAAISTPSTARAPPMLRSGSPGEKALPSRPVSSHTLYDPDDAYGGM